MYYLFDRDDDRIEFDGQNKWRTISDLLDDLREAIGDGRKDLSYRPWVIRDHNDKEYVKITGITPYINKKILVDSRATEGL